MAYADEHFEFAGKTLQAKGTSGRPTVPVQYAAGRPVGGGLTVGGRAMQEAGTSGSHLSPIRAAIGRPVRPGSGAAISSDIGTSKTTGTGQRVGEPTRIS